MKQRLIKPAALCFVPLAALAVALFQNCGRVSMMKSAASIPAVSPPVISLSEFRVKTTLNKAKTVDLQGGGANAVYSFAQGEVKSLDDQANGSVRIDSEKRTLTFTPKTGYRGELTSTLYATEANVTNIQHITFEVVNPVLDFKPALAVRGSSCLMCHAQVRGDLVSDYGFKNPNDDLSVDYFLKHRENVHSIFATHYQDQPVLETSSISGNLVVPKVNIAEIDRSIERSFYVFDGTNHVNQWPNVAEATFKEYIEKRTPPKNMTGPADGMPQFKGVVEKNKVFIGSPSVDDIIAAGGLTPGVLMTSFKNAESDPAISGIEHVTKGALDYFTNTGDVTCDGDLFIDGPVLLKRLRLKTTYGCRIYSTHTVFITGAMEYVDVSALSNLQIASAVGIGLGLGYCEDDCLQSPGQAFKGNNSVYKRTDQVNFYIEKYRHMTGPENKTRFDADAAKVSTILNGGFVVPAGMTLAQYAQANDVNLIDANTGSVREEGTTFNRLLLVAPSVMSRYSGNFQGIVISEFAIWKLGQFSFTFDPVFTGVPLLPFLDFEGKILDVK